MKAKRQGTSTVAPKATYLRCSQPGQVSSVSVPAPESQKKARLKEERCGIPTGGNHIFPERQRSPRFFRGGWWRLLSSTHSGHEDPRGWGLLSMRFLEEEEEEKRGMQRGLPSCSALREASLSGRLRPL